MKVAGFNEVAVFAGGCYWCMQKSFSFQEGVIKATAGFAWSKSEKDKREVVRVEFDPKRVSFEELVNFFLLQIDSSDGGGQFFDRGFKYTTAIYWMDVSQKQIADEKLELVRKSGTKCEVKVVEFEKFEEVPEADQEFWKKYPDRYSVYVIGSGRQEYFEKKQQ